MDNDKSELLDALRIERTTAPPQELPNPGLPYRARIRQFANGVDREGNSLPPIFSVFASSPIRRSDLPSPSVRFPSATRLIPAHQHRRTSRSLVANRPAATTTYPIARPADLPQSRRTMRPRWRSAVPHDRPGMVGASVLSICSLTRPKARRRSRGRAEPQARRVVPNSPAPWDPGPTPSTQLKIGTPAARRTNWSPPTNLATMVSAH